MDEPFVAIGADSAFGVALRGGCLRNELIDLSVTCL